MEAKEKIRMTLHDMELYGYLKCGVILTFRLKSYKFVSFTYDYVDNKEEILYVLYDIKEDKYIVCRSKDYENKWATITNFAEGTKVC